MHEFILFFFMTKIQDRKLFCYFPQKRGFKSEEQKEIKSFAVTPVLFYVYDYSGVFYLYTTKKIVSI